jgi:hypothetical protein
VSTSEFGGAAHVAIFSAFSMTFAVGEGLKPVSAGDEAFATMDEAFDEVDKRLGEVGIACYCGRFAAGDHEDHWLGDARRASEGRDGGSVRRPLLARQAV